MMARAQQACQALVMLLMMHGFPICSEHGWLHVFHAAHMLPSTN
jgi:hypothetical protein